MARRNSLKERSLEPPRRDPMLDFAVKDTWRIFRIMGEFVEGFETLSTIMGVSIFGSARSEPGSPDYRRGETMGQAATRAGLAVVIGGGVGVQQNAQKGADAAGGDAVGAAEERPACAQPQPDPHS